MLRIFLNKNIWKLMTSKITRHTVFIPRILHQKHFDESRSSTIYALSSGGFIFSRIFYNFYIFIKLMYNICLILI